MKQLVEYIVKNLVNQPDEVNLNEIESVNTIFVELRVGKGDLGQVIGKNGQTARAIRTVLAAVSAKQGKRSHFEILE